MTCENVALALQTLSTSIQELASHPSSFVLHRSYCRCLAASYTVATRHVLKQLQHTLSTFLEPEAHRELTPSLSELHHVILQGYKFMQGCLHQQGWVQKAVILTLSTEAQDVHLHDLVWCLCVIQQAMNQLPLQANESDTNVYTTINAIWTEASHEDDLKVILEALESEIKCISVQKISRKEKKAQRSLAKFLWKKLSWENDHANGCATSDKLPHCFWVDSNEFRINETIGNGAYAVVHEVKWCGQIYGQKEFFEVDEEVFAREAAIQARLRHPNLLQLICCTSKPSKNKCSLVMELMDSNLRSIIDKRQKSGMNPPFSLLTAVDLMLQIAKGMEHLHGLHIMHRDLKSMNILVTNQVATGGSSSDCRMHLKIADFGMSKAKNQSSKFTSLHVGTSYWRAPEVFRINPKDKFQGQSTAKYTKEADVYSFSMVCFEILSGKVPFDDGGKLGDLHVRLSNGERPQLPAESCPPYLASYIERCWDGNPKKRPTFAQISRMLRHLKGVLLTSADPLTPVALSVRSLSHIEDKLTEMMGSNWPFTVSGCVAMRSLTISFEMSWYRVMENQLTEKERIEGLKGSVMKRPPLAGAKDIGLNRGYSVIGSVRKKGNFSRSMGRIMVLFSWCSSKSSESKAEVEFVKINGLPLHDGAVQLVSLSSESKAEREENHRKGGQLGIIPCRVRGRVAMRTTIGEPKFGAWDTGEECGLEEFELRQSCGPLHRTILQLKAKLRRMVPQQEFGYSDLAEATGGFQASACLGMGGSGKVFKGVLKSGQAVAVKVMPTKGSIPFDNAFEAEVDLLINRVSHPNLVPLLGYCFHEKDHLMLVYKHIPRGNLAQYLQKQQGHDMALTWFQRCKIAIGVASALEYLHNECIPSVVHRDVKPSNVLLDDDFNAYLADFGAAMRMVDDNIGEHASVRGTKGYLDPEYVMTLRLGPETDVYGFGVVLLQLVSGREFFEMDELGIEVTVLNYVERLYEEGSLLDAVDGRVRVDSRYDAEMSRLLMLGLVCCAMRSRDRPSMRSIVKVLLGEIDAPIPIHLLQPQDVLRGGL